MRMRLAIMQPYFMPYIGYYQLLNCVDKFIVYDDVNFINQGWINRNKILLNGKEYMFTVPLKNASQNRLIKDIEHNMEDKWKRKFFKRIGHAYTKSPYFEEVMNLLSEVFSIESQYFIDILIASIELVKGYLGIKTELILNSSQCKDNELKGQDRIISICQREGATSYINPIGGEKLYSSDLFSENDISLRFIRSHELIYEQFNDPFNPWLSIIDVMMFNSVEKIQSFLTKCDLTK
jgi:hypothetical protein